MSVLNRAELEASPLADLHALAAELGLDGFRRLRKPELIDRIVVRAGGSGAGDAPGGDEVATEAPAGDGAPAADAPRPRRRLRGRRSAASASDASTPEPAGEDDHEPAESAGPRRSGDRDARAERTVEGVVELLDNGSGFVRVNGPEHSDDDVYISAAQVRRCDLVSGDRVSGPVRAPRRSERFSSLLRVAEINGTPADEVAAVTRYDDLPAAHPGEAFALGGEATLEAIARIAPFGRGSRVTIAGGAGSGKTEVLLRVAAALRADAGLDVSVVLAGARPEEASSWSQIGFEPSAAQFLSASADAISQAVERGVEVAKRVVARGGHAVVLIDSLDRVHQAGARKALAAARNVPGGGSLTVIATAAAPIGGETTVVALDTAGARAGRFPALDEGESFVIRRDLLAR